MALGLLEHVFEKDCLCAVHRLREKKNLQVVSIHLFFVPLFSMRHPCDVMVRMSNVVVFSATRVRERERRRRRRVEIEK
jgi:hypothetical protein